MRLFKLKQNIIDSAYTEVSFYGWWCKNRHADLKTFSLSSPKEQIFLHDLKVIELITERIVRSEINVYCIKHNATFLMPVDCLINYYESFIMNYNKIWNTVNYE